jgi:hypothetical protein
MQAAHLHAKDEAMTASVITALEGRLREAMLASGVDVLGHAWTCCSPTTSRSSMQQARCGGKPMT